MNPKRLMMMIAILALAAPAMASRFPVAWAGIWTLTEVQMDCDGEGVFNTVERIVELSGGERPVAWDPELDFTNATYQIDATTFTYSGSRTETDGECEIVTTVTYSLTREDDTVTGFKQVEVTDGGCEGGFCYLYQVSGSRGSAPVESMTWSTVKSLYD